ncbi:amino acid adenylation domain-containing protein [Micromonospora sp. NPDC051196]|uniref:amino acid adenylation domain-containing protein n=1 Tax=Micromonospora sp. NPDC051196 TaxID=3155281 RepID=UPI003415F385
MTGPLARRFDDVARRHPERPAVVDCAGSMTYGQLRQASAAIADDLGAAGAGAGHLIGIRVGRNAQTVTAIIGVLRTGAAYVALDPSYPADRIEFVRADAGLDVIVDSSGGADRPTVTGSALPRHDPLPADLAYLAYTSGSTGRPKGCLITQHNVLAFLDETVPLFDLTPDDRWTVFHSPAFDASVWELWGALATGATAVMVPDAALRNPAVFARLLADGAVTVVSQVPSALQYLLPALARLEAAGRTGPEPAPLNLRYLFSVGEAIRLDLVAELRRIVGGPEPVVVNMYGPTETTVFATMKEITEADLRSGIRSPIGHPLPKAGVVVVGPDGSAVPPGETGELWITGETVGLGYLNRPELTTDRFVSWEGAPAYRTGDLGRQLPDGSLEHLGRLDQQLKVRGYRIEPEEIEEVLRRTGLVVDAGVCLGEVGPARFLTACVTTATGLLDQHGIRSLRDAVATILPEAMCPDRYVLLDRLPQNAAGKIDRPALAELVRDRLAAAATASPACAR